MELFKNVWVVGISTGVISGILVFFLTNWIMKKKGKEEYYRHVAEANNSVINALKPYIADQGLPSKDIFDAIIHATARNFSVVPSDMYTCAIFCEELIREVITDVYVSTDKKKEYLESLSAYKIELSESRLIESVEELFKIDRNSYAERTRKQFSIFSALVTAILGVMSVMVSVYNPKNVILPLENMPLVDVIALVSAMMAGIVTALLSTDFIEKNIKRAKKNKGSSASYIKEVKNNDEKEEN